MEQDTTQTQSDTQSTQTEQPASFAWKGQLSSDFANSPTMQKYADTKEGFNDAVKAHLSLEKMLGQDKVVLPKGPEDLEGHNRLAKALGVPDRAEQYGLADAEIPDSLKGLTFDKNKFAEIVHTFKLTPSQAKGLWQAYTDNFKETYQNAIKTKEQELTQVKNKLKGEWGDAYESNVELGQLVINKFSSDQETQDFVTSSILANPMGAKFLSRIGQQFQENKIGEFGYRNFSLTPDQAQAEIDEIVRNPKDPYNDDKASPREREKRIDYVNSLYKTIAKARG